MRVLNNHRALKLTILSVGLIAILGFLLKARLTHEPFDAEKWKNWTETESTMSMRWDMMNGLRNNYELVGKSKKEIIDLLGEPESKMPSEFRYFLGYSRHGINTGSFTIEFNKEDNVKDHYVWDG
ncbi:MAG: hypothetical protein JKY52_07325 [Flavobacteriales bacterium]|nr:hypothetical protein [Flavobacteriales bacterium]